MVPTVQVSDVADVVVEPFCFKSHKVLVGDSCVFPQSRCRPLSCSASSSTLLFQGVLRAQGLQTFRLVVPILSHAYVLLQEFVPMVFDYREHGLRFGGLLLRVMMSLVVSKLVSWSVLACNGHVHVLTQHVSVDIALVSVNTSRVSENTTPRAGEQSFRVGDTALVTVVSLPVVAQQLRLLDVSAVVFYTFSSSSGR